jgi:hypothetical protein
LIQIIIQMLKKAQKTGNAWTVKIGEGSGPQGPLPKSRSKSGSGPRFMVVNPGVHYQGPLHSPILTVQALV